ncbi:MAG: DUF2437 domain-containing protein [Bryobacterales bacterium]|nr:DUF2437 domain-containing protein [Bryobacterales bacterium]
MKLIRFSHDGAVHAGVVTTGGIAPVTEINARTGTKAPNDLLEIIRAGRRPRAARRRRGRAAV